MRRLQIIINAREPLIQYLLGELNEVEAKEIEDKLAIDQLFYNKYSEAENILISAYVNLGLSEPNMALFEKNFLNSEERRLKLKLLQEHEVRLSKVIPPQPGIIWLVGRVLKISYEKFKGSRYFQHT